jgi:hypothetical protein
MLAVIADCESGFKNLVTRYGEQKQRIAAGFVLFAIPNEGTSQTCDCYNVPS